MSLKIWFLNFVWKSWCNMWYGYSGAELISEVNSYSLRFLVGKSSNKYSVLFSLFYSIWAFEELTVICPQSLSSRKEFFLLEKKSFSFFKIYHYIHRKATYVSKSNLTHTFYRFLWKCALWPGAWEMSGFIALKQS